MDVKSVERAVNMLAGSLHMRMDYNSFSQINTGQKKLLIVEGQTDERFISEHLCDDVLCVVANKAFGTSNGFSPKPTMNCKNAIIEVVYGLSVWPTIIKCPKGSENWVIFGMIDMDFDEADSHTKTSKLFITDTHDLETLMLYSDSDLLQRIKGCVIGTEDVKKAYFMAYQLGKMRQLFAGEISTKPLSAGNGGVDYSTFFIEDYQISMKELISYLNKNSEESISAAKEKKLFSKLLKDKSIKKYLTKEGCWATEVDSFDESTTEDFWEVVNGHDILSLLRYVNEDAAIRFRNSSAYSLNREFEMSLIEAYNPDKFRTTRICSRMVAENVVKA